MQPVSTGTSPPAQPDQSQGGHDIVLISCEMGWTPSKVRYLQACISCMSRRLQMAPTRFEYDELKVSGWHTIRTSFMSDPDDI